MSNTLYRKYRPQKFSEVVAQNHIKVTLQNEITSGKLAHAYLFSGPRGIGKTTMARILAKTFNCQNLTASEPCDNCSSCLEIKEGRSLDLVEIDAASNRGINEIKELREQTKYTPLKEKYKVFIIDEAHMLTNEAFNALLKTLEEPPAHAIFILATTEIHKIPETIISRCQRFDYKKVPLDLTIAHLAELALKEGIKVDSAVIANIARASDGYLRDAVSLLGQILSLGEKEITIELASLVLPKSDWQKVFSWLNLLLSGQAKEAVMLVDQLVEEGVDLEYFAKNIVESLRKILLAKVTDEWQNLVWEMGEQPVKRLRELSLNIATADLVKIVEIFLQCLSGLKQASIIQLPLEIAAVKTSLLLGQALSQGDGTAVLKTEQLVKQEAQVIPKTSVKAPAAAVNLEKIRQKWPEVIEALKDHNHSLASFLKVGVPVAVEGSKVILGFQYQFHFERIKEKKNLAMVEDVLARVFGINLSLNGLIGEQYGDSLSSPKSDGQKGKNMVEAVLETLGGEVVN